MTVRRHPCLGNIAADVEDEVTHISCCLTDVSYCGVDCENLPTDDDCMNYCTECQAAFDADPDHCPSGFECLDVQP